MGNKMISSFLLQILEHFFGGFVSAKITAEMPTIVQNLDSHGHGFPGSPSDADRDLFVKHTVRQVFRVATHHGFPADVARDFFTPRVEGVVRADLRAGLSTAQAAAIVGKALAKDIQSLAP